MSSLAARTAKFLLAALLCSGLAFSLPASAQDGAPTAAVKSVVDAILAVLRSPGFDLATDRPAIRAEIQRAFDDTAMAQSVLSTNWRQASKEQQNEFKTLHNGSVTLSIGMSLLEPEDTAHSLLERCDKANYQAKAQGGNAIVHLQTNTPVN